MRYLGLLLILCPLAAFAQPAENDPRTLQALLNEVQQLRLAIERSTLLGARTQLAVSQLQVQEERSARLSQQLAQAREALRSATADKNRASEVIRELEAKKSLQTTPEVEDMLKQLKYQVQQNSEKELQASAREGEIAPQALAAQREVQDSRAWIAEMQRSLDAAIQQILKPR